MRYATLYERLVASTKLAVEDNPHSCWIWTGGTTSGGYPRFAKRVAPRPAPPKSFAAHRAMLEEVLDAEFPFDEAGHLCCTPLCINPDHLEVQTKHLNLSLRRGHAPVREAGCMIPTLFPREAALEAFIAAAWEGLGATRHEPHQPCPF